MAWGLIASLQALTRSFAEMLILRVLLGISEAAFSPGVPFYLSFFYRREELAFRVGLQVSAAPLAASFAGSLAWAITRLGEGGPLAPWRLLFLVEGFPSVLVAVIAWNFVPDSAGSAKFLSHRQRQIASVRLQSQEKGNKSNSLSAQTAEIPKRKRVDWREIFDTVKDPKCYLTAVRYIFLLSQSRHQLELIHSLIVHVFELQYSLQLYASFLTFGHQPVGIRSRGENH